MMILLLIHNHRYERDKWWRPIFIAYYIYCRAGRGTYLLPSQESSSGLAVVADNGLRSRIFFGCFLFFTFS